MFSYAKAKLKMQKRMQPYAIRFTSLDNKTMQTQSKKGYLQQKIGTSCGRFGNLSFVYYI